MGLITKGLKEVEASCKLMARTLRIGEARAVKRAGTTVKNEQAKAITDRLNLRARTIKDSLVTKREPDRAHLQYTIAVRGKGVPLREFIGTRQTRKGVSVAVLKGGSRATLGAAFGVGKFGGHFFGRTANGSKKYGSPHVGRGPITKLFGPQIIGQYQRPEVLKLGEDTWDRRIGIELEREQTFALKQAGLL